MIARGRLIHSCSSNGRINERASVRDRKRANEIRRRAHIHFSLSRAMTVDSYVRIQTRVASRPVTSRSVLLPLSLSILSATTLSCVLVSLSVRLLSIYLSLSLSLSCSLFLSVRPSTQSSSRQPRALLSTTPRHARA